MRNRLVWLASVLVLVGVSAPAGAGSAPGVLGILEIRGLDNLAAAGFELTKAAGNPMPKEALSMMLYGALGTMPGMGLQPDGRLRALWLDNGTDPGGAALLLPVENGGADYLKALGDAGWRNASAEPFGIQHFTAPDGAGLAWSDVYFLKANTILLAAPSEAEVKLADEALGALPSILPAEGDIAIQIQPAALAKKYSPKLDEALEAALQSDVDVPAESLDMARMYIGAYLTLAQQLEAVVIGLGIADARLNLHMRLEPVAGSTAAQWLATVQSPAPEAGVVNLPGALFVQTLNLGDTSLLAPAYFNFMEKLLASLPQTLDAEFKAQYMENIRAAWAQIGGDLGVALLAPTKENPLRLAEYVAVKDPAALRDLAKAAVESENKLMAAMAASTNMPAPFQFSLAFGEPREHRGIPIDTLAYTLTPGPELAPLWPEGLPTRLAVETAWLPGGMLVAVGDAALTDEMVDRVLDGTAAPVTGLPAWQELYPAPDADLVEVSHVALFEILRAYLGVVDGYTGGSTAANIPAGPGYIESAAYKAQDGLMGRMRVRLADIAAAAQRAKEAQEKAMADMLQQMQLEGAMEIEGEGEVFEETETFEEANPGADLPDAALEEPADEPVEENPAAETAPAAE